MDTKKKNGRYRLVASILVFFVCYSVYSFLFTCRVDIEIFNNEFEQMMNDNLVSSVVCIKNREIVNVQIKNECIRECIEILNKSRGFNVLKYKNGILNNLRGIFAKKRSVYLYMVIPSVYIFDKNFKSIENNLGQDQRIGYEVTTYVSWIEVITKVCSSLFTMFFLYYILLGIGLLKGGKGGLGGIFGDSKGKLFDKNDKNKITFDDIAGLIEPKAECREIIELMNNTKKLNEIGGKMPKGILFVGPPGNGKTLLARAIAGECNASFFYVSASDIGGVFFGAGVLNIRQLFKDARANSPSIVYIDEIDSIGRKRSSVNGVADMENTLNALLVEMDGFDVNSGILVIGSTNRLSVLDKALIRPGRFDVKILIDKPVLKERIDILKLYINKLKLDRDNIDIDVLAKQTVGFSAAEIYNVCNIAALLAARLNKDKVDWLDFQEAFDRVVAGLPRRSYELTALNKEMIAYHEAGHIVTSWHLKYANPVLKVTIIARGYSLGYAQYTPDEKPITTREEKIDDLCTYLGGRCAEELKYNTMSTGASNDLEHVYRIAFSIVTIYGMNEKIGKLSYNKAIEDNPYQIGKPFSEETAREIDEEIRKLVDECYCRVKSLLTTYSEDLKKVADELLKNEELKKDDIEKILGPRDKFFE